MGWSVSPLSKKGYDLSDYDRYFCMKTYTLYSMALYYLFASQAITTVTTAFVVINPTPMSFVTESFTFEDIKIYITEV